MRNQLTEWLSSEFSTFLPNPPPENVESLESPRAGAAPGRGEDRQCGSAERIIPELKQNISNIASGQP